MWARNPRRALFAVVAGALVVLACAAPALATEIEWSVDLDCSSVCHTRQTETLEDESSQIYASHAAFACTTCHTDVEGMEVGHEGVTTDDTKGPKKLKKSEVTEEGCLACHQVTDGVVPAEAWAALADEDAAEDAESEEVEPDEGTAVDADSNEAETIPAIPAYSASATADIAWLTDANDTTVNPHDLPVNKSHATISCATCHDMHSTNDLETTATKACIQCHHDNVYECFTCHD